MYSSFIAFLIVLKEGIYHKKKASCEEKGRKKGDTASRGEEYKTFRMELRTNSGTSLSLVVRFTLKILFEKL